MPAFFGACCFTSPAILCRPVQSLPAAGQSAGYLERRVQRRPGECKYTQHQHQMNYWFADGCRLSGSWNPFSLIDRLGGGGRENRPSGLRLPRLLRPPQYQRLRAHDIEGIFDASAGGCRWGAALAVFSPLHTTCTAWNRLFCAGGHCRSWRGNLVFPGTTCLPVRRQAATVPSLSPKTPTRRPMGSRRRSAWHRNPTCRSCASS